MAASSKPEKWLDGCIQAHRRLEQHVANLTDELARRDSVLPGWTVGHVLTHLARNADGHTGMAQAAQAGQIGFQYPGGQEQRERDIANLHSRPAAELVSDLRDALRRLEDAWAELSNDAWATALRRRVPGGPITSLAESVFSRWRETEVHFADLGLAELAISGWDGLSPAYVEAEWPEITGGLGRRVPDGFSLMLVPGDRPSRVYGRGEQLVHIRATPPRILQWLLGRGGVASWPELAPWGTA
ncbi:MAG TPA: maleylpyruvate isomerase N-terminal domain-containing protein [Chloroflexota bacterium]|nr:maleylpyruvate isomerase N-terminal domain-containing protein [Chloroflexota bacterium]